MYDVFRNQCLKFHSHDEMQLLLTHLSLSQVFFKLANTHTHLLTTLEFSSERCVPFVYNHCCTQISLGHQIEEHMEVIWTEYLFPLWLLQTGGFQMSTLNKSRRSKSSH